MGGWLVERVVTVLAYYPDCTAENPRCNGGGVVGEFTPRGITAAVGAAVATAQRRMDRQRIESGVLVQKKLRKFESLPKKVKRIVGLLFS